MTCFWFARYLFRSLLILAQDCTGTERTKCCRNAPITAWPSNSPLPHTHCPWNTEQSLTNIDRGPATVRTYLEHDKTEMRHTDRLDQSTRPRAPQYFLHQGAFIPRMFVSENCPGGKRKERNERTSQILSSISFSYETTRILKIMIIQDSVVSNDKLIADL